MCNAAEHVKFFVTELDNGDVGFAYLTIQKLREVCSGLYRSVVSGILSNLCPFLCVSVIYLPRGDCVTGFKSPDRERFTALFAKNNSRRKETLMVQRSYNMDWQYQVSWEEVA